jgi:hypothetical protein
MSVDAFEPYKTGQAGAVSLIVGRSPTLLFPPVALLIGELRRRLSESLCCIACDSRFLTDEPEVSQQIQVPRHQQKRRVTLIGSAQCTIDLLGTSVITVTSFVLPYQPICNLNTIEAFI